MRQGVKLINKTSYIVFVKVVDVLWWKRKREFLKRDTGKSIASQDINQFPASRPPLEVVYT